MRRRARELSRNQGGPGFRSSGYGSRSVLLTRKERLMGKDEKFTLTPGALARRWGVDRGRIHALIRAGKLRAFKLPGAGRYGEVLKIPVEAVLAAEEDWAIVPQQDRPRV